MLEEMERAPWTGSLGLSFHPILTVGCLQMELGEAQRVGGQGATWFCPVLTEEPDPVAGPSSSIW